MKLIGLFLAFTGKLFKLFLLLAVISPCLYIAYKGNQPMSVPEAPAGMTYFEFLQDRAEAANVVRPARCGWGMFLSLATLGPMYSVAYTETAIHPGGFLAGVTAPDPDIPQGVENATLLETPGIWWNVVERLSWTMLGKQHGGCRFRPVMAVD